MSTIGLVDPKRLSTFVSEGVERDQLEVADVLLLAKADIATDAERTRFTEYAQQCFPPKRFISTAANAVLSVAALAPPLGGFSFQLPQAPAEHAHAHHPDVQERSVAFGAATGSARVHAVLGRQACGWNLPRELVFNRVMLHESLLQGASGLLTHVDRLKAVLRTGVEHWTLFNVAVDGVTGTPCGWRQDSRIEVQLRPGSAAVWPQWDAYWQSMLA
jgi:G3E family GTPase